MEKFLVPVLFLGCGATASARDYDLYRSDYFKGAFCSAIGGACAADDDVVTALFMNPAALATGVPKWDFDGDYVSRAAAETGSGNTGAADSTAAGGFGISPGKWGAGAGFVWRRSNINSSTSINNDSGSPLANTLDGKTYLTEARVPFAFFVGRDSSIGATLVLVTNDQNLEMTNPAQRVKTDSSPKKLGLTVGGLTKVSKELRVGTWFRLPLSLDDFIEFSSAATGKVLYREDFSLHYPWIWGTGFAWQGRSWELLGEADVIGNTRDGFLHTYRSYSSIPITPRPKGRALVVEPHLGTRFPLSSRITLHLGSYYRPPRLANTVASLHGTSGISLKIGNLLEVIGGVDVARRFTQLFFTFR